MSVSAQSVLSRWAAFDEVVAALSKGVPCLRADGLWGSSRALATAGAAAADGPADPDPHPGPGPAPSGRPGRRVLPGHALGRPRRRPGGRGARARVPVRLGRLLARRPSPRARRRARALLPAAAGRRRGGHRGDAFRARDPGAAARVVQAAHVHPDRRRGQRPGDPARAARGGRLRAGGDGARGRAVEPAGRHRRHLLAHPRPAGARRVLRRRGGVVAPLRSHLAALDRRSSRS